MGLGSAYRAGHAIGMARGYDVMVQIDADLSHDPAALPDLLAAVERGADLAIGSRYVPGGAVPNWPKRRLWLSVWGNRYAGFALGMPVRDSTAGYRAYRASILQAMQFESTHSTGYAFQIEMTYRARNAGGRIDEVPIAFTDRVRGTSKMSSRIVAEAMTLVTLWGLRDRVFRRRRRRH
jgi:glycosyltransferase involved in cell wall biosynthesis